MGGCGATRRVICSGCRKNAEGLLTGDCITPATRVAVLPKLCLDIYTVMAFLLERLCPASKVTGLGLNSKAGCRVELSHPRRREARGQLEDLVSRKAWLEMHDQRLGRLDDLARPKSLTGRVETRAFCKSVINRTT